MKLPLVNIHQCLVPGHEAEIPLRPACENKNCQYSCKTKNLMDGQTEGAMDRQMDRQTDEQMDGQNG